MHAIVERALVDAHSLVERKYSQKRVTFYCGNKIDPDKPLKAVQDLEELINHLKHEWFGQICEYAGLHQDKVLKAVSQMEERARRKYGSKPIAR